MTRKKPNYGLIAVGLVISFFGAVGYADGGTLLILVGFIVICVGICGFSLRGKGDPSTQWGYEPRAGWDPDRGGGV